jgi:hypothetical protein
MNKEELKAFKKAKAKILKALAEELAEEVRGEETEEELELLKKVEQSKDYIELVNAFIEAAWDLQSFLLFLIELDLPKKALWDLVFYATYDVREWST